MKKILLSKIKMTGFKIYKDETTVDFSNETILVGGNGKGKSSVADAIAWCITGKIYDGKKRIEDGILNNDSKKAVVELEYTNEVGEVNCIKRTYTKASGATLLLNGDKISQQKLSEMINPDVFLLNFNPCSFLGKKPIEARKLIVDMTDISSITDKNVLDSLSKATQKDLLKIVPDLSKLAEVNVSVKKDIALNKKNIVKTEALMENNINKMTVTIPSKEEFKDLDKIELITNEIDEMVENNPHITEYEEKNNTKNKINEKISEINGRSYDSTKLIILNKELNELKSGLEKEKALKFVETSSEAIAKEISISDKEVSVLNAENNILRESLRKIQGKYSYKEGSACPCCKQKISASVIKDMKILEDAESKDILTKGVLNKNKISDLEKKIIDLTNSFNILKSKNEKLKNDFEVVKNNKIALIEKEIVLKENEIKEEEKIQKAFEKVKKDEIKPLKEDLKLLDLKEIKDKMLNHSKLIKEKKVELKALKQVNNEIKTKNKDIDALIKVVSACEKENKSYEKEIAKLNKEISKLEKGLCSIRVFNEEKIKLTEELMSKSLKRTSFKVEEITEDGEIKPCFKIIFDGKLIEQCSLSEQMKAGMEIVEMLKDTFDIDYPMFLDNSESITEVKTAINQLIRTVVVDVEDVITIDNSTLDTINQKSKEIVETFSA